MMSSASKEGKFKNCTWTVLYVVILLGLIIAFHTDLFIAGVRIYVLAVDSPRAERLLGDYYSNLAQDSTLLANGFYQNTFKKFNSQLNLPKTPKEQALLKNRLGELYECGRGVSLNLTEAKRLFEESLKDANEASKSGSAVSEKMLSRMQANLADVNQSLQSNRHPICKTTTPREFIENSFS